MASVKQRPDGKWRARYRDSGGKEHAQHFRRKTDAQRWLDEITTSKVSNQYVDPRAGRVTFRQYAEQWRDSQVHRPSTRTTSSASCAVMPIRCLVTGRCRQLSRPIFRLGSSG